MAQIRPSADLRNKYNEISTLCHESREPVYITVNGRGDTAILGIQEYEKMKAELNLLRMLAESEDDVIHDRIAPIQETFEGIREALLKRKNHEV